MPLCLRRHPTQTARSSASGGVPYFSGGWSPSCVATVGLVKATFPAVVFAALTLAACTPPVLTDDQKQPEAVRIGMSSRQVESLMGPSHRTCWIYELGEDVEDSVCFEDGMVHTIGRRTRKPGSNEGSINAQ